DIKPSNLMLSEAGQTKVLDLGLARLASESSKDGQELTSTGQLMGTIDYMAPEQAHHSHSANEAADLYSLGATLYRLLRGRPPLAISKKSTVVQKLMALERETPPPITDLRPDAPSELAAFVQQMLAKAPEQRPESAEVVAATLACWTK